MGSVRGAGSSQQTRERDTWPRTTCSVPGPSLRVARGPGTSGSALRRWPWVRTGQAWALELRVLSRWRAPATCVSGASVSLKGTRYSGPPEPPASCDPARMSAWPSKVRAVGTVWEPAKCPPPCVHPQKTALPGSGDPAVDWGSLHRNRGVLPCPRLQLQTGEWEGKGPVRGGPRNASSQGP